MKIYAAYMVSTRSYYEDVSDSHHEHLFIAGTDLEELRLAVNEYFARPGISQCYKDQLLVIQPKALISNTYSLSGGGCFASGHVAIRELKTEF